MMNSVVVLVGLLGLTLAQYSYRQDRASSFLMQVRRMMNFVVVLVGLLGLTLAQYSYRQDRASSFLMQVRMMNPITFRNFVCEILFVFTTDS